MERCCILSRIRLMNDCGRYVLAFSVLRNIFVHMLLDAGFISQHGYQQPAVVTNAFTLCSETAQ